MTTPDLDPDLLKAFVAVVEHRSFTRAACALNRTQSAVSMQIRRLEDRLGVVLFHRSTVQVELSPAGEGLVGYARRILALNQEAVSRLRAHEIEGHVRLGMMDDYGSIILPPLLAGFAAAYPGVRLGMETGLTAHMPERLGQDFDIVVAMHEKGEGAGAFVRRERAIWAGSHSHGTAELDPLPLALYPAGCLLRRWAIEALDRIERPWRLAFVSHSLAAVEAVVAEGLAVTVVKAGTLPARLCRLSANDGLPDLPAADIRLHRATDLSAAGTLLADHLVTGIRQAVDRRISCLEEPTIQEPATG